MQTSLEELRRLRLVAATSNKQISEEMRKRRRRTFSPSVHCVRVVCMLYALLTDPCKAILIFMKRRWRDVGDVELLARAADIFLNADLEEALREENVGAWREAKRLAAEQELFQSCREMNLKGIAPSTAEVLRIAHQKTCLLPNSSVGNGVGALSSTERNWSRRWRLRWKARIGRFRVDVAPPLEELQRKVSARFFLLT